MYTRINAVQGSSPEAGPVINEGNEDTAVISTVLDDLNERKARENNIIIYDSQELKSKSKDNRKAHATEIVKQIFTEWDIEVDDDNLTKVVRIGKFDSNKKKRPILVTINSSDKKKEWFKNISKLRESENEIVNELKLSNDLTKEDRKNELKLYQEAKDLSAMNDKYKVKGQPWARRIVKVK